MLRIDGRVLVVAVLGVFVVGGVVGFVAAEAGTLPLSTTADADPPPPSGDGTPLPGAGSTPVPTPPTTASSTTDGAASTTSGRSTRTSTPSATATAAPDPSPTATATRPATPTADPTRTPMLVRRFEVSEIEAELRRLLNEWRTEQGLQPFGGADGALVADLNAMAADHSVAMADAGLTIHELDNVSSADRYRAYDRYWACRFEASDGDYLITPDDNRLEVLARTYAGVTYETGDGTDYNGNETAVARDVFVAWTTNAVYRQRLRYPNASRIGIGIEITNNHEVYVTGNVCGTV